MLACTRGNAHNVSFESSSLIGQFLNSWHMAFQTHLIQSIACSILSSPPYCLLLLIIIAQFVYHLLGLPRFNPHFLFLPVIYGTAFLSMSSVYQPLALSRQHCLTYHVLLNFSFLYLLSFYNFLITLVYFCGRPT